MRGVCFSPPKVKRFTDFSESATPVKLKKFRLDTSANTEDLLMGHDVSLESLSELDFDKTTMPTSINLNTIKSVCIGQLVTVTAKVSRLHPSREVKSKNLELQEAMLVDPCATMKLILWADFIDSVLEGDTYTFHNIRVNKDKQTGDIYFSLVAPLALLKLLLMSYPSHLKSQMNTSLPQLMEKFWVLKKLHGIFHAVNVTKKLKS